jgi:L-rhamnose-H+ transport protein
VNTTIDAPIGILIFTLGGLAAALFYIPLQRVKGWAWESYWLIYAVAGLLVVPWALALATTPNLLAVLDTAPRDELLYCFLCGAAWGVGGLTWGLMLRYLGVGLGMAMGAGLTSAVGTLLPPMLKGAAAISTMFHTPSGIVSVIAALVSLAGIVFVGLAGMSKESELSAEQKKKAVAEFDFKKGMMVAVFSGLMSAAMSFGLQGGPRMQELAMSLHPTTAATWAGMPVLVVVLLGGFVVNAGWCLLLNVRNRSVGDYVKRGVPLGANLGFAVLAGTIWCSQFVSFKAGEPLMGSTSYIGWAVLMAAQILFSQLLGIVQGEWKGTGIVTRRRLGTGLALLAVSACLAGYGPSLG